jgi:hypothetical protein
MKIKAKKNLLFLFKNPKLLPTLITNELSTIYPELNTFGLHHHLPLFLLAFSMIYLIFCLLLPPSSLFSLAYSHTAGGRPIRLSINL